MPDKTSRLRRTTRLARKVAGAAARRVVDKSVHAERALGLAMVDELDELKGMAMKVGQILSYMDGALPAETQAVLARLQQGTAAEPWPTMAAVVSEELGADPSELFDAIDPVPVASASIGQVHRATLHGRPVAVKIRYPHIRETFTSDVTQLHRIARIASLATSVDGAAIVEELRDRLLEECDYDHEARWQQTFRGWLAPLAQAVVPEVIASHSSSAVLTSAWVEGQRFEDFRATATQAQRNAAAHTLCRVAWFCFLQCRAIQADPHPGNTLFLPDADGLTGRVAFLDYGCVRAFEEPFFRQQVDLLRCVVEGRRADFEGVVRASGMVARERGFDLDLWWEQLRWQHRPYCSEHFVFTPEYVAQVSQFNGPGNPNMTRISIPPPWIWLTRLVVGLHAVMARLGAEGDFRVHLHPG